MLDAAGFAPALRGAVTRASRARTARKLADARDVLRDPDAATALSTTPRAARWRAAVRACLRKLLTHVKRRDQFDDGTCTSLWSCVDAALSFGHRELLAVVRRGLGRDHARWTRTRRSSRGPSARPWRRERRSDLWRKLSVAGAPCSRWRDTRSPCARKLVALGALGACARVRDGTVRSSKLFGSTVDQLYAKLEASTRPPPEPTPRKKWPTFADCLRDAEDKIHAQAEAKLAGLHR